MEMDTSLFENLDLRGKIVLSEGLVRPWKATAAQARGAIALINVNATDQRHNMIYASTPDLEEAYEVGRKAVLIAKEEDSGYMATILRRARATYSIHYDKVPLDEVANSERSFPQNWIDSNRIDVTNEFISYAQPLIGEDWISIPMINGRQR